MANQEKPPRVLLADDHDGVLACVSGLLRSECDIVGTVSDGFHVIAAVTNINPDLIVMDIGMPGMDGIRTARELRKMGCTAKIVFLTVSQDEDYISAAFAAGAAGYVLKARMQSDLITAVRKVLADGMFVWEPPPPPD